MPLPTVAQEIKQIRGTHQKCRDKSRGGLTDASGLYQPDGMSKQAQKYWDQLSTLLIGCDIPLPQDSVALSILCEVYATWRLATDDVAKNGLMITDPDTGKKIKNPHITISEIAYKQLRPLLTDFGMTPASRAKIQPIAATPEEKSPWDEL